MSVLMVAVTVLTALGRETVVRRLSANTDRITRVAGVVLVVAGLVQIYYFLFVFDGIATLSGL
jgi:cytochrome c-type biogenesis protein